jgi:hypothetical protein
MTDGRSIASSVAGSKSFRDFFTMTASVVRSLALLASSFFIQVVISTVGVLLLVATRP